MNRAELRNLAERLVVLARWRELLDALIELLLSGLLGMALMLLSERTYEFGLGVTTVSVLWMSVNLYKVWKVKREYERLEAENRWSSGADGQ